MPLNRTHTHRASFSYWLQDANFDTFVINLLARCKASGLAGPQEIKRGGSNSCKNRSSEGDRLTGIISS